ncbi:MAG TPA: AMP-binding protein, partial [Robiginitalea sp.]|nr:AMP-binding protein [Robiginitalea sp.]
MSNYHIKHLEEYFQVYRKSVRDPEAFWEEIAEEHFIWRNKWDRVLRWDFKKPEVAWFEGARLNITENCLDRHLPTRGHKTAIIFEPNDPGEEARHISYRQLHELVCRMANVLRDKGVSRGDRVCIYLPMIPELAVAVLACARIGAIHSVVFAGFSSTALATRINDSDCKLVITSDGSYRGGKTLGLKGIVDTALQACPGVETVLVVKRTGEQIDMLKGRDHWIQPLLDAAGTACEAEIMEAEDPLFILYTSGSTGRPKGMVHSCAGYMVYTAYTFKNIFQYRESDIYWCTADIGW